MKKTVLVFGTISGLISSLMILRIGFGGQNINFDGGEVLGYASIVLSFILVFFGIRSYRENKLGGTISFGKAFKVGILITVVSSLIYVVAWMIVYYAMVPDFMDQYSNYVITKMKASGESAADIDKMMAQMETYKDIYKTPLGVAGVTFLEPFPVGLIITLVSSLILKRKRPAVIPA